MRTRITLATALFALTLGAAIVAAEVSVYENTFSAKSTIGDLQKLDGGKECKRGYLKKEQELALGIVKGAVVCSFATPVRGDAKEPDHNVEVEATIQKPVPKSLADDVYVAIGVRNNDTTGYELRVFPGSGAWELRRDPEIEGFPMQGTDAAVEGLGKVNKLALQAFDDRITASVNGTKLVDGFIDPAPADVEGRRTTIAFASDGEVKDPIAATFDDLEVRIPDPG